MKLDQLQVSGFGHLSEQTVQISDQVTVLCGPNEAGKSTLLGFIRSMLFGIPSRTYGTQRYEPIQGTVHGGVLSIVGDDGAKWAIERYAQPPGGKVLSGTRGDRLRITVTESSGLVRELSQEAMQRELLGGMSKEMFKQLFAVSLTELQEVGALHSEEMSRFLFHAGIGGGSSILRGERKLVQQMDKLYKPRGRNQEIPQALSTLEKLERELNDSLSLLPTYNTVLAEIEVNMERIAEAEEQRSYHKTELNKLQRALELRAQWMKRAEAILELKELPKWDVFPEQAMPRWNTIKDDTERLEIEYRELMRKVASVSLELDAVAPNDILLQNAKRIQSLAGRLPVYESKRNEWLECKAEDGALVQRLSHCLRQIDPQWTPDDLTSFAATVGERETIRLFESQFAAYDREMEQLRNEQRKLERDQDSAIATQFSLQQRVLDSQEIGQKRFVALIPQDANSVRRLWKELQIELDRWREYSLSELGARKEVELDTLMRAKMHAMYRKGLNVSLGLTVVVPLLIGLMTSNLLNAGIIAVLFIFSDLYLGWAYYYGGKSSSVQRKAGNDTPESSQEARLQTLLSKLISHPLTAASQERGLDDTSMQRRDWEREAQQLRMFMEEWQSWAQQHESVVAEAATSYKQLQELQNRMTGLEREMTERESSFNIQSAKWEQWLGQRKLSPDLSPVATLDIFRLAEQGMDMLTQLNQVRAKLNVLVKETDQFEHECHSLELGKLERLLLNGSEEDREASSDLSSSDHGNSDREVSNRDGLSPITLLQYAINELDYQMERKTSQDSLLSRLAMLEEEKQRTEDRLQQLEQQRDRLLSEAYADDENQFLRNAASVERREQLEREVRQWEVTLYSGSHESARQEIDALLSHTELEQLSVQLEDARSAANQADANLTALQEQRGRLLQEKESLQLRCQQDDLLQQIEEHKAELHSKLDKYAVLAVCTELIAQTRRIYEEERQPEVLRIASEYFTEMTGGRYKRIVMMMGSNELMAEHTARGLIDSAYLSRGTAEQLYLAMRLALSGAVSHQVNLPLVFDDLFVNFDATRLNGALTVLAKVAEQHQLILLTCHDHIAHKIQFALPQARIVHLG